LLCCAEDVRVELTRDDAQPAFEAGAIGH